MKRIKKVLIVITICCLVKPGYTQTINGGWYNSVMLCPDNSVWTVGSNFYGQLGINGTDKSTPIKVPSLTNIIAVGASFNHTIALRSDSTVWGWGGNTSGQLGNGTTNSGPTLIQATGLINIISVSAGYNYSMALRNDGTVWAWGINTYGQLGDSTTINSITPIQVFGLTDIIAIGASSSTLGHSVALKSDGTIWSWGNNNFGQLGNGTTNQSLVPVQVSGLTNIVAIGAGDDHSIALRNDSTVWTWGASVYTSQNINTPIQILGLTNVVEISAGGTHNIALLSDSTVWTWGRNGFGQLGDSTIIASSPVQALGLTNIISVGAGSVHSMAFRSDSTVWTWGNNGDGQLGIGSTVNKITPTQMSISCPNCLTAQINIGNDTTICKGSAIDAGNGYTTYNWNNNLSNNQILVIDTTGIYYVTVSDNSSCIYSSDSILVTVISPSVIIVPGGPISICVGNSIELNTSIEFADYNWSNGDSTQSTIITQTGDYFISITDSIGCVANSDTVTVTANPLPTVSITGLDSVYCIGSIADTLTGLPLGGVFTGVIGGVFDPFGLGTFTITYSYTDTNGCTATQSQDVTVANCTGVDETGFSNFEIYPNPSIGIINLKIDNKERVSFEISNAIGRIVYSKQFYNEIDYTIDLSNCSKGIYFVKLRQNNTIQIKKLLIL